MQETAQVPLLLDWSFWAVVVAFAAVLLSQLPPIQSWFRKPAVRVEVSERILINHKLGSPSASLFIHLSNPSPRDAKAIGLRLSITPPEGEAFELTASGFLKPEDKKGQLIFWRVPVRSHHDWSAMVQFAKKQSWNEEKDRRYKISNLKSSIQETLAEIPPEYRNDTKWVEAGPESVSKIMDLFKQSWRWHPGEYLAELEVKTEPEKATVRKALRFILFESDCQDLYGYSELFKYGAGVYFDHPDHIGVFAELHETT